MTDETTMAAFDELMVKRQLHNTLIAYQTKDGTVDMVGWLAETCRAFGVGEAGPDWKAWAYMVIGQAELIRGKK